MSEEEKSFENLDYIIFALMLSISAGIGIFFGCFGKQQITAKDVLVANREAGAFPVGMSLFASFMSSATILGVPYEVYAYGTMYFWSGLSFAISTMISAFIFVPLFVELGFMSAYQYLEKRFNKNVRLFISCLYILSMIIYLSFVLYGPAVAINQVTKMNIWVLVITIGIVSTFYTTIGGMVVVLWTDVFQVFVMFIGLFLIFIIGLDQVGGYKVVVETNWLYGRIEFFDFDPTVRHTVWGLTIGSSIQWLAVNGVNQCQVQRFLCASSIKIAQRAMYFSFIGYWITLFLIMSIGMIIFTNYKNCDILSIGKIRTGEQIFPYFIMDTMKSWPGVPGIFLACLFSAVLSTISSGLNSLAAVTLEDIIRRFIFKDLEEKKAGTVSKILCVFYGLVCLIFTYVAYLLDNTLQAVLSLFSVLTGPILGVFLLGIFVPFSNSKGAFVGVIASLLFTGWIFIGFCIFEIKYPNKDFSVSGCNLTDLNQLNYTLNKNSYSSRSGIEGFHSISYQWYGLIAVTVVLLFGSIVSLFTGITKPSKIDSKYILPFFDKFFCCLPLKLRIKLRLGYNYSIKTKINQVMDTTKTQNETKSTSPQ